MAVARVAQNQDYYVSWVFFVLVVASKICTVMGVSPNVVFILTDDVGYGDLAVYGHPYAKTPNIDRMAHRGTRFLQFHTTGNVCPTTRAGFMTSKNPSYFPSYTAQYGLQGVDTVTKMLKEAGYRTGHVGKWNIGMNIEVEQVEYGIDEYNRGNGNGHQGRETSRVNWAIDFIDRNKDRPFYLNVWLFALHTPITTTPELLAEFDDLEVVDQNLFDPYTQEKFRIMEERNGANVTVEMKKYLADLYGLDLNVGRILNKLDDLGLTDNTIVVFTSDNGPQGPLSSSNVPAGSAGGLRGEKHSWYEGGHRVPFIVQWPGQVPEGKVNTDSLIFGLDWLPTIGVLAGADVPWDRIEGEDISDIWKGSNRSRRNPLFWRILNTMAKPSMKYDRWKLLRASQELYDLRTDPGERTNLWNDRPDIRDPMLATMAQWIDTLPTVHHRGEGVEVAPFDPTLPMTVIGPPDFSGGDAVVPPTPLPTPLPTIAAPTPTPPTGNGPLFSVPFTASALGYTAYLELNSVRSGNCNDGNLDAKKLLSSSSREFCQSDCTIGWTESNEYVEYDFEADSSMRVRIIARVSSFNNKRKVFEMELVDEQDKVMRNIHTPGQGWDTFEARTWDMDLSSGFHTLRVLFTEGATNLCSISVERLDGGGGATPPSPTPPTTDGGDTSLLFTVPFTANALKYSSFRELDVDRTGNCNDGNVDAKKLSGTARDICESDCAIGWTARNEYVEYSFRTTQSGNSNVTVHVSSVKSKRFRLELMSRHKSKSTVLKAPAKGWDTYEAMTWNVDLEPGEHRVRVVFVDGLTNLCSLRIN